MHPLPQEKRKAVLLIVEGESVLHGTLPTSSLEPTVDHSNIGSALVTKKGVVSHPRATCTAFGDDYLDSRQPGPIAACRILYCLSGPSGCHPISVTGACGMSV